MAVRGGGGGMGGWLGGGGHRIGKAMARRRPRQTAGFVGVGGGGGAHA